MESFFLEKFVYVSGSLFREASRGVSTNDSGICFRKSASGTDFGPYVLVEKRGLISVGGFRALKYDVRHTPIVIERIAKEWKLKRT
jgi:hypothetical protein